MTVFLHLISTLTVKTPCNCAFFSLQDVSITAQNFCHVFLLLFGYFCRWHFFFHFHLRRFWRRKKWRIWCCFEESIAVEERDLVQVGLPTGSGTILADLFPIYIRRFFSENRLVEIYIIWFPRPWYVKIIQNLQPWNMQPFFIVTGELVGYLDSWHCVHCTVLFSFKVQVVPNFFRKQTAECWEVPPKKHSAWFFFWILEWLEVASLHRRS